MWKLLLFLAVVMVGLTSRLAAETTECIEITSAPVVISAQGVYCLKSNLGGFTQTSGNIIDIQVNNVTIDLNGFKIGGNAAGESTGAIGIYAENRINIVIRNGTIRGFGTGIYLNETIADKSSGHLLEDLIVEDNKIYGVRLEGKNFTVRNNRFVKTGGDAAGSRYAISVHNSRNFRIVGNHIADTNSGGDAFGIRISASSIVEIANNAIFDTNGTNSDKAISLFNGDRFFILNNKILNQTSGTVGIDKNVLGSAQFCIGNVIAGFSSRMTNCTYTSSNHPP